MLLKLILPASKLDRSFEGGDANGYLQSAFLALQFDVVFLLGDVAVVSEFAAVSLTTQLPVAL